MLTKLMCYVKKPAKERGFPLTPKHQRKLGGVIANGIVLGVNELADGKAITAVKDISMEFEKLRRVAEMLGLPIPIL